jgi:PIN domain nuclease of toxin-antitoxin system
MRLLLDTVTFLCAVTAPERLSKKALSMLRNTGTIREIAIKHALGKLEFRREDLQQGISDQMIRVLPYTAEHAQELFSLPLHHKDPFDRQILAQALVEKIPVVTPDAMFHLYSGIKVIW